MGFSLRASRTTNQRGRSFSMIVELAEHIAKTPVWTIPIPAGTLAA